MAWYGMSPMVGPRGPLRTCAPTTSQRCVHRRVPVRTPAPPARRVGSPAVLRISSSPEFGAGAARLGGLTRGRVPWPVLTAGAGVLAAALTTVVVGTSEILDQPRLSAAVRGAFVLAVVAGGAYTW